jgi:hypothetical protein
MKALVVYESMFGNTQAVAQAVAEGISTAATVELVEVGQAPRLVPDDISMIVVGAPTHAFSLSRQRTRADARQQAEGPLVTTGAGLREWLLELRSARPLPVAAFDTRIARPRVPGSAARAAMRRLRRRGHQPISRPTSFYVTGTRGPLSNGELDRARAWGATLVVAPTVEQPPTTSAGHRQ